MGDTVDFTTAREKRIRDRKTAPAGAFGPSHGKQVVIDRVVQKTRQAEITAGRVQPTPERITSALDIRGLYGPEVDIACGVEEPAVDEWEAGTRVPTREQIEALARLTGFPVGFFYQPAPKPLGSIIICGEDGCQTYDAVDDRTPSAPILALPGTDGRLF